MQWYYLNEQHDQVAIGEEQLTAMVEGGQLTAGSMIWREDFEEWLPCSSVFPDFFQEEAASAPVPAGGKPRLIVGAEADMRTPTMQTPQPATTPVAATTPLAAAGPSMAAVGTAPGVITQGYGAPAAVSEDEVQLVRQLAGPLYRAKGWMMFMGILLCLSFYLVLPLLAALKLFKACSSIDQAYRTGHRALFNQAQDSVRGFFVLQGWTIIVMLVLSILAPIILSAMIGAMFAGMAGGMGTDPDLDGGGMFEMPAPVEQPAEPEVDPLEEDPDPAEETDGGGGNDADPFG